MEAFVFTPSNIVIGTFQVQSLEEIPARFRELVANNPAVQVDSYIVASGKSWILTSIAPFQLQEGPVRTPETAQAAFTANAQFLAGADRGQKDMIVGAILFVGGIVMTAFSIAAAGRISLWAVGAMGFGGIQFFRGVYKRTEQ